jgi:hypothetical protein
LVFGSIQPRGDGIVKVQLDGLQHARRCGLGQETTQAAVLVLDLFGGKRRDVGVGYYGDRRDRFFRRCIAGKAADEQDGGHRHPKRLLHWSASSFIKRAKRLTV